MIAARLSPGAISESSSSHLPPKVGSKMAKPVMFPPGWLSRGTMPLATGSPRLAKTIGIVCVELHEHADAPYALPLLRPRRERPSRRASERDYEFSSCNRDSHWTPLRQVSTLGSGTIPCFGGCMNPLIQPPSRPDACYGSSARK